MQEVRYFHHVQMLHQGQLSATIRRQLLEIQGQLPVVRRKHFLDLIHLALVARRVHL